MLFQRTIEKMDKHLDLAIEVKKRWNIKLSVIPIVVSALGTVLKGLIKKIERIEDQRKNQDYADHSIVEIG